MLRQSTGKRTSLMSHNLPGEYDGILPGDFNTWKENTMFDPSDHPTADWPHALSLESLWQDDGTGGWVDSSQSWVFIETPDSFPDIFDPYLHFLADTESFYDLP